MLRLTGVFPAAASFWPDKASVLPRTDQGQSYIPTEGIQPRVRASEPWAATARGLPHCLSKHYTDLLPPFPQCPGQEGVNGLYLLR